MSIAFLIDVMFMLVLWGDWAIQYPKALDYEKGICVLVHASFCEMETMMGPGGSILEAGGVK